MERLETYFQCPVIAVSNHAAESQENQEQPSNLKQPDVHALILEDICFLASKTGKSIIVAEEGQEHMDVFTGHLDSKNI